MGKKIVFENLPQDKKVRNLLELLDPIGTVQWVFIPTDQNTRRSTGLAYVEMWNDTEAETVVNSWNQREWDKRVLTVRIADQGTTPETLSDKASLLSSPPDFIFSVIRFQLSAPPGSLVFIDDVPKAISDEAGYAVIRGLLPGNYQLKVVYQGRLLTDQAISVNCDKMPPKLAVNFNSAAPLPQPAEVVPEPVERPVSIPSGPASTLFAASEPAASRPDGRRWLWVIALLIIVVVGGVVAVPRFTDTRPSAPPAPIAPNGMVYVPSGKFIIGRADGESEYEKPIHEVRLAYGYFMDKTEVTNYEYLEFTRSTSRTPPPHWGGKEPSADIAQLPVVNVSWEDGAAYCRWKGARDGLICRLPSEVEWEHAARGEKNLLYTWGNDWRDGLANANQGKEGKLSPVGSNAGDTSPFGLLDMNGNVREWTRDNMSIYQGGKGDYRPQTKVVRGGAFNDPPERASSTFRSFFLPDARNYDNIGFRCMCELY